MKLSMDQMSQIVTQLRDNVALSIQQSHADRAPIASDVKSMNMQFSAVLPVIVGTGHPSLAVRLALVENSPAEIRAEMKTEASLKATALLNVAGARAGDEQRGHSQAFQVRLAVGSALLSPLATAMVAWLLLR